MASEPRWLTRNDVVDINRREVQETGEPFLLRDPGLLEGALARPRNLWTYENERDVVVLAARLLFAIAGAHAFEQGNKRTAFSACGVFLAVNGYRLVAPDSVAFAEQIIAVIERNLSERDFVALFRPFVSPV